MGMAAAHHPGIGLPGQVEIVGVLALAADERVVLLPQHRLADAEFLQCDSVLKGSGGRVILHCKVPKTLGADTIFRKLGFQITHGVPHDNA